MTMATPYYRVEPGVPIPQIVGPATMRGLPKPHIYPFADMQVGDSFLVPEGCGQRARQAATAFARRHGVKFLVAATDAGRRVWRVA
jgi:hypothetical protein